ncbi:MAG TPA: sialidase family protein [Chloroflexia bacterium]|nr:sialidase family protein [Chloroflexia bacterium]
MFRAPVGRLFRGAALLGLATALVGGMSRGLPAQATSAPVPPQGYQTNTQFAASNRGIANVQASSPTQGGATDVNGACQGVVTYNQDHSESDLALDPQNPQHLLGASKFFYQDSQYIFHLGSYTSFDGGASFANGIIPDYDCVTSGDARQWQNTTDPTVTFDGQGGAYTLVLAFNWSSTNTTDAVVGVSKSTDGGQSWGRPAILTTEQSAALGDSLDKQWISARGPHVFAAWAVFGGNGSVTIYDSYSSDSGATWSRPTVLASPSIDQAQNTYVYPRFAPDGTLYVAFTNTPKKQQQQYGTEKIYVLKSTDSGVTFTNQGQAVAFASPPYTYQNTTFRDGIDDYFQVSPYDGALLLAYQAWNLEGTGTTDIFALISHDGGLTWSTPILVNDDPNTAVSDQLQPAIAAAPNGRIAVAFYDRRLACPTNDANILPAHYGAANFCINTAVQFYDATLQPLGHNVRASATTWDPEQQRVTADGGTGFIGDYFALALSGSQTFVLNVSTANLGHNPAHYQQQFLQTVPNP